MPCSFKVDKHLQDCSFIIGLVHLSLNLVNKFFSTSGIEPVTLTTELVTRQPPRPLRIAHLLLISPSAVGSHQMLRQVVSALESFGTQMAAVSGRNILVILIHVMLQRHLGSAPGKATAVPIAHS